MHPVIAEAVNASNLDRVSHGHREPCLTQAGSAEIVVSDRPTELLILEYSAMPLRTSEQYRASLQDSRRVFFRGQRVEDVTTHPVMSEAVAHASIDFDMAEQSEYRSLAVVGTEPTAYSRYYHLPTTSDDLFKRSALIEAGPARGAHWSS